MHKLSVAIMTYNEEDKIEKCLKSVQAIADEILILDSFSTDNTLQIAKEYNCRVVQHQFLGYIEQRALNTKLSSHDLVLALDADEYLSEELIKEIGILKTQIEIGPVYKLNRLSSINGKWIRHGKWFPHKIVRLFDKNNVTFGGDLPHDRIIPTANAKIKILQGLLMHDCNDDIHDRILTINNHSTQAAQNRYRQGKRSNYIRLLTKPIFRFSIEYILNRGFLDGFYGFIIAKTAAQYVFLRESKMIEIHRSKK